MCEKKSSKLTHTLSRGECDRAQLIEKTEQINFVNLTEQINEFELKIMKLTHISLANENFPDFLGSVGEISCL